MKRYTLTCSKNGSPYQQSPNSRSAAISASGLLAMTRLRATS